MDDRLKKRARRMRREPTSSELKLWTALRDRDLNGYKFRRQQPVGPFIVDFFCSACGMIVELDGGSHEGKEAYDEERTRWLEEKGFKVLRLNSEDVRKNMESVLEVILLACEERKAAKVNKTVRKRKKK